MNRKIKVYFETLDDELETKEKIELGEFYTREEADEFAEKMRTVIKIVKNEKNGICTIATVIPVNEKQVGDIWAEQIGSRKMWTVQFPKGRMTFCTKKVAMKWVEVLKKGGEQDDTT